MGSVKKLKQKCEAQAHQISQLSAALKQALEANKKLSSQVKTLQLQVDQLIRYRFGQRSERFEDADNPQMALFDELIEEPGTNEESDRPNNNTKARTSQKGKPKKRRLCWPDDLKIVKRYIDVDETQIDCACGKPMKDFDQEVTDRISYQPEAFFIDREIRVKRSCSCGKGIAVAPAPKRALPGIAASNELLAQMVVTKCLDRQPFYHLEKRWNARHNVIIPRDNMARWSISISKVLQPIYNLLSDQLSEYDIASLDATWLQVLKEDGRMPQTRSKAWCFIGGLPDKQVVLFEYNDKDHSGFIKNILDGFDGKLHGDADNCYTSLGQTMSYCNAHSRRHYEPIAKATSKKGIAHYVMTQYQLLYDIEAKIKSFSADKKYEYRQRHAKPILDELKAFLIDKLMAILPSGPLGKAVGYTLKYWDGLTCYLDDGRLSIDNNHTERTIRQFVLARNNFIFADTVEGAKSLCMHMSLIQTAMKNGQEPYDYYTKVLEQIPYCETVEDYEMLLPWNIDKGTAQQIAA